MVIAKNPILKGFYPDPSICRVGDDYYIVNSSFVYSPGVPIFHSKDLAHFEQIGNILETETQNAVFGEISRGIFAPTIRYHEGTFYMITTNIDNGGIFVVTATNPEGPWSEPYYLGEDEAPGFDPDIFFDDDGKCYLVGSRPNSKGTSFDGDWEIWVRELDLSTMKLVGKGMAIWNGALRDAIWPEGPHIYKIDGYYYLLHAEGGTGPEHAISIARSKELFKWFEGCPRNPIFSHRNFGKNYPITNTGHGDLFNDKNGNWYIVMLASRPCKQKCSLGRETFLAKVEWEDGWPVINPGEARLTDTVELPFEEVRFAKEVQSHDEMNFNTDKLDDRFVGISKRNNEIFSLTERKGFLRLYTRPERIEDMCYPSYLGLRQKDYGFSVNTGVDFEPKFDNEVGGIVLFQNHENHLVVEITRKSGKKVLVVREYIKGQNAFVTEYEKLPEGLLNIELRAKNQIASIYIEESGEFKLVKDNISLLPYTTEEAGGFVGCTIGMYTSSNGKKSESYCDFAWFNLEEQN